MDPLKSESEPEDLEHQELSIKVPKEEYKKIKNKARKEAKKLGMTTKDVLEGYIKIWKIKHTGGTLLFE
jgi:hypothetical protein